MTITSIHEVEPKPRVDSFLHSSSIGQQNPLVVDGALRAHAIGYSQDMGFVNSDALTTEGYMQPDIDHARGDNVDYHLAVHPDDPSSMATMRMINLLEGETICDLPAFQLTRDSLSPEGRALLEGIDSLKLKEIAALAKTDRKAAVGLYETIRKVIQESLGKDETWFFSIVAETHDSLSRRLGQQSFTVLGADTPIDDDRVDSSRVQLRPVSFIPDDFFNTMLEIVEDPNTDDKTKEPVIGSLLFFTDGVEPDKIDGRVMDWRKDTINFLGHAAAS